MLNFVTAISDQPQAALIRGIQGFDGPGKLTKKLLIDKSFYGENLILSDRIWIEKNEIETKYSASTRIGVDYAGDYWKNKPWRYILA